MTATPSLAPCLNTRIVHRGILALTIMIFACHWPVVALADHQPDTVLEVIADGPNAMHHVGRNYLIDHVASEHGQIDVGDSIRGINIWEQVNDESLSPAGMFQNWGVELTSVFQVQVTGKQEVSPGAYTFTFGPDPSFAEAQALGLGGRAMMVFYEDIQNNGAFDYTHDIDVSVLHPIDDGTDVLEPSPQDVGDPDSAVHESILINTGADGQYFWALGYSGAVVDGAALPSIGEGWGTQDGMSHSMLPFFSASSSDQLESINFSLARLTSATQQGQGDGIAINGQSSQFNSSYSVAFNGSQTWSGLQGLATPFEMATQGQLNFAVAPLPSAGAMTLLLLSALGGIRHWRQRRQCRTFTPRTA